VTKSARTKRTGKISEETSVRQGDPRGVTGRPVWAGV